MTDEEEDVLAERIIASRKGYCLCGDDPTPGDHPGVCHFCESPMDRAQLEHLALTQSESGVTAGDFIDLENEDAREAYMRWYRSR